MKSGFLLTHDSGSSHKDLESSMICSLRNSLENFPTTMRLLSLQDRSLLAQPRAQSFSTGNLRRTSSVGKGEHMKKRESTTTATLEQTTVKGTKTDGSVNGESLLLKVRPASVIGFPECEWATFITASNIGPRSKRKHLSIILQNTVLSGPGYAT
jgi:hypothetical protein